jgi:hypothetical protein
MLFQHKSWLVVKALKCHHQKSMQHQSPTSNDHHLRMIYCCLNHWVIVFGQANNGAFYLLFGVLFPSLLLAFDCPQHVSFALNRDAMILDDPSKFNKLMCRILLDKLSWTCFTWPHNQFRISCCVNVFPSMSYLPWSLTYPEVLLMQVVHPNN